MRTPRQGSRSRGRESPRPERRCRSLQRSTRTFRKTRRPRGATCLYPCCQPSLGTLFRLAVETRHSNLLAFHPRRPPELVELLGLRVARDVPADGFALFASSLAPHLPRG